MNKDFPPSLATACTLSFTVIFEQLYWKKVSIILFSESQWRNCKGRLQSGIKAAAIKFSIRCWATARKWSTGWRLAIRRRSLRHYSGRFGAIEMIMIVWRQVVGTTCYRVVIDRSYHQSCGLNRPATDSITNFIRNFLRERRPCFVYSVRIHSARTAAAWWW